MQFMCRMNHFMIFCVCMINYLKLQLCAITLFNLNNLSCRSHRHNLCLLTSWLAVMINITYIFGNFCIVTYLWVCDYGRGMDWWMDFLTACIHHPELHFTDHWHTQNSVLSLLPSSLAVCWQQWRFFSFLCSGPLVTAVHAELVVNQQLN
jgi:hypothetical protein